MPEEFDPRWEYYEPDPEIVHVLSCDRNTDISCLPRLGDDQCFGFRGNPQTYRHKGRFADCKAMLTELWTLGHSIPKIASVLSVEIGTVIKWKKKLNLPARKPGGYSRSTQIKYMQKQKDSKNETHR